jgi:queuosine precursor transporter
LKYLAAVVFVGLVAAANWLTATYGLVLDFVTAGTFAAGLVLLVRDWLHEAGGRAWVFACIGLGAALSVVMSTPQLAVASGVAFAASEFADFAVYEPLRKRTLAGSMALSNTAGAVVDSLLFLALAGFPLTGWLAQSGIKVAVTLPFIAAVVLVSIARRTRRATA